ncbi:MAG TPA: alpha/beta hydrolase [Terriglobales bacterium]|nr:alpha/beta hydrolase [Terriglobales bacterium]
MLPVTHRFITSNGIRMHLAEQGEGPLVILCHGWPELWYSWRHQMGALAEAGYHVVAPDLRGFGQTDAPAAIEAYQMLHVAADIVGIVDALGAEQAFIAGHDWGAPVAWNCALFRPDIFKRLILLSVPYIQRKWGNPRPTDVMRQLGDEAHEFYMMYFQEPGRAEAELEADIRRTFIGTFSGFSSPQPHLPMVRKSDGLLKSLGARKRPDWLSEADLDVYVQEYQRTGFRGGLNYYRNLDRSSWEMNAAWTGAKIQQPSLFIAGEYDSVVRDMYPAEYQTLETVMPGLTRKVLLPEAGHWVQQQRPAEVSRLILDFLRQRHN